MKEFFFYGVKQIMSIGLILEGGGNRGTYTAGVLDVLMDNNIFFPITYAISAGACNALSYISKQRGRNYEIISKYTADKRYLSFKLLRKTGSIYGFDFIFGELSKTLVSFDYDEFFKSGMQIVVGATDCETGKTVFFDKSQMNESFIPVRASSSMPVVSNIVEFQERKLLDGGVTSPIPIEQAIADGIPKNVIILTRDKSYVKKQKTDVPVGMLKKKYKEYPELIEAMKKRPEVYNNERKLCYEMQEKGDALIIQPSKPITIGKYCKSPEKLKELYDMGVNDAKENLVNIRRFIALNS